MKLSHSPIQSMSVAQRTPRALLWLTALAAMLFAGGAWGQAQPMRTQVIAAPNVNMPLDPETLYPAEGALEVDQALFEVAPAVTFDTDADGDIDQSYADFDGAGPGTVGLVDWMVVELRIVVADGAVPTGNFGEGTADTRISKTALLRSDGYLVDPGDLEELTLELEDVDFDPDTQDLYIVVDHRNHVAVMSSVAVDGASNVDDTDPEDGVYTYDFTVAAGRAYNDGLVDSGGGTYALYVGDTDGSTDVSADDVVETRAQAPMFGYLTGDANFDGGAQADDIPDVRANAPTFPEIRR